MGRISEDIIDSIVDLPGKGFSPFFSIGQSAITDRTGQIPTRIGLCVSDMPQCWFCMTILSKNVVLYPLPLLFNVDINRIN